MKGFEFVNLHEKEIVYIGGVGVSAWMCEWFRFVMILNKSIYLVD